MRLVLTISYNNILIYYLCMANTITNLITPVAHPNVTGIYKIAHQ